MARKSQYWLPNPATGVKEKHHLETELAQIEDAVRQPDTAYALGDARYLPVPSITKKMVCVKAGTTGSGALALSSADEGAITTDGGVVWMVDSLADGIYTAAHKNGIARGADLTAYWDNGYMSANIQAGVFVGIYIGDYIDKAITVDGATKQIRWLVAGLDSYLHSGANETSEHHAVLISENVPGTNIRMNPTNTTEGGFTGSEMWTTTLPKWTAGVQNAFGAAHVLRHEELLTNSISATAATGNGLVGVANNWEWKDVYVNIPNEPMVYGGKVFGGGYDVGTWPRQLPLFALKGVHQTTRQWYWLRAVASASYFCDAGGYGNASYIGASTSNEGGGLRPYFLLR